MDSFRDLILSPLYESKIYNLSRSNTELFFPIDDFHHLLGLINVERVKIKGIYCDKCDTEMSFSVKSNANYRKVATRAGLENWFEIDNTVLLSDVDYKILSTKRLFLLIRLVCNHDEDHIYYFNFEVNIIQDRLILRKIGQTPENYVIDNYENYGFSRQLKNIGISKDFKNIHVMLSYRYYVCALLYLRRTLEKIIDYLLVQTQKTSDTKALFDEKISFIRANSDLLSPDITDISTTIYKLSSLSIHSLEDSECNEYIGPIYEFIVNQLTHMKNKEEAKKKITEAKKMIEKFSSEAGEKKNPKD